MGLAVSVGRVIGRALSVFYIIIGVLVVFGAFYMAVIAKVSQTNSAVAQAECTPDLCKVVFRYRVNGNDYSLSKTTKHQYKVGDKVQLYYQFSPDNAMLEKPSKKIWYGVMGIGFVIILYNIIRYMLVSKSDYAAVDQIL